MKKLEQKRRKRLKFENFHKEQPDGWSPIVRSTRVHAPAAKSFKKTSNILQFTLIIPIFSPSRQQHWHIISSSFLLFSTLVFEKKTRLWSFVPWDLRVCKGRMPSLSIYRRTPWTKSLLILQSCPCLFQSLSLYFLASWLSSQLVRFRVLGIMDQWGRHKYDCYSLISLSIDILTACVKLAI